MKKKILSLILAGVMVMSMAACAVKKPGAEDTAKDGDKKDSKGGYELALITDVGTIDDKSFNQGSWEGLEKYAKEHDITYKYYKPAEKSDEACLNAIDLAVKGGAKVVATPGFLFEVPVYEAQTKYPDVSFIIIDAQPVKDGEAKLEDNVLSIFYAEEQAGYLAGYAAVTEGYRNLGFMGGIAVPAVIRYGYGFVQGADAAAKDMGLKAGDINIKYTYVGNFDASPENNAKAAAWYNEGTECIFACGGGVGNSVMKAAETADKVMIGVDVDQSVESETVITSAMKNLGDSIYGALEDYYNDSFQGGKTVTLDAAQDGVKLPMETSKFKVFTQEKYDELYSQLKDGTIKVGNDQMKGADDKVIPDATGIPTDVVKVELIK